jgi:glucose-6-phosphate isomerase
MMPYEALRYYSERNMRFAFVSNVDDTDFAEAVRALDPAETLFIVSSKTLTTWETVTNARTARAWALAGLGNYEKSIAKHFVAVSTNAAEVAKYWPSASFLNWRVERSPNSVTIVQPIS